MIKILALGDTYGEPGRNAVEKLALPMKRKGEADFILCNAENAADGSGITARIADELFQNGCDVLTCGDHVFDKLKDIEERLKTDPRLVRPSNFPKGAPGSGSTVVECKGTKIGVIHLAGQVFMRYQFLSPFAAADEELEKVRSKGASVVLVDMHCEATSEKMAMSWHLDGRVSAVVGSHTHIQTADERVTPKGTAAITDLGMTGPYDSIIGAEKEAILKRFITQMPVRKVVAQNDVRLCGALISVDERSGKALSIERIQKRLT